MVLIGGLSMLPTFIGVFLSSPVTKKIGIKKNLMMTVVTIITSFSMFFLPPTALGKTTFIILFMIGGFFTGISQPAQGVMTPIAVDYGEWKYKKNSGGFFGALNGFLQTFSTAIAGGLAAMVLALVHYVPDVEQTATTLAGIKFMMKILPGLVFFLGLIILKWDMTDEKHRNMVREINTKDEGKEDSKSSTTS